MIESKPSRIEALAQHLQHPVDEIVRTKARLHLLDWLGCVAGAHKSRVAEVAKAAEPDALTRAALLGNVLEMDDVHRQALLHPGPVVWPAALSAVRETGAGMSALLDGAVRGYEAMIAIGASFDAFHYARFHNTSTAGGFGGAAAAASVFGLSAEQTAWALGNAGSIAGGLWHMRHDDVMTKQMHVAHAALSGLWQARLARAGFTGPKGVLEGPQGLYEATAAQPHPLALGEGWRIGEVSFKPWAACRHCHPAIDAALELREAGALEAPFRVETYADAVTFCDRPEPRTELEAKFSLQHAIALIAAGREADAGDFTPEAIERVAALRRQVSVVEAGEFTSNYPAHFGARVSAGGRSVTLVDTLGDPERPASADRIKQKFRSLAAWGERHEDEAERAIDLALENDDVEAILALLEDWL